jgi:hypothetical protein
MNPVPSSGPSQGVRRRWLLLVGALIAAIAGIIAYSARDSARADTPNPIVLENQQPGTTAWKLGQGPYLIGTDAVGQIKGYASATSVNVGGNITFKVSVNPAQSYTIAVYRMGCYPDASGTCLGGRLMQQLGPFDGIQQPACAVDGPTGGNTGLTECNWTGPSFAIPTTWTSGIYLAVLTNANNYQNDIEFVVRDDSRPAALLYQQPVATYEAYNNWPDYGGGDTRNGKSLYDSSSGGADTVAGVGRTRAVKVSFDRPFADTGANDLVDPNGWSWELYFVQWMEQHGYDVSYSTSVDLHTNGSRLLNYKGFLSVGHDEYWSKQMFDAAEAARDAGVNLGFFGGNDVYWQIRFEPSSSGDPNRVIVGYKNSPNNTYSTNDPVSDPTLRTVRFQDPPVNRPAQTLLGTSFAGSTERSTLNTPYVVQNADNWAYAGSGFANGSTVPGTVGYEADGYNCHYPLPRASTFSLLATSPLPDSDGYTDTTNSVLYRAPGGAWVFDAGTMSWSWALSRDGFVDSRLQRTTATLLDAISGVTTPTGGASTTPDCSAHKLMNFEDGTLTGANGADRVVGPANVAIESAAPISGGHSVRISNAANSYLDQHLTAVDDLTVAFSLRLNALPAADTRPVMISSLLSTVGQLFVRSTGQVCLKYANSWAGGSTASACSTTSLTPGSTYTLGLREVRGTGSDGVLEAYLSNGTTGLGAPFVRMTTGTWTTRADRVSLGSTNGNALDAVFDDVVINGVALTTPAAPTGLSANALTTSDEIDLSWNDASSNETSYVVERSTDPAFPQNGTTSFRLPAGSISYRDLSVTSGVSYSYRVKAVNAAGTSDSTSEFGSSGYSNVVSPTARPAPPAAPSGLSPTFLSRTQTRLDWTDNSSDESGFVIQRSASGTFADAVVTTVPPNTTSYTDTLPSEGPALYRVAAVNGAVQSAYTAVVSGSRIKDLTFEDGTPSLVNSLTGATTNANGGMVQELASPLKGTYSARVPNRNNTYLEQTFPGADDLYVSFYVRLAALPTADMRIAQVIVSGGGTQANLWVRSNGTLCLKYNATWSGTAGTTASACTATALLVAPTVYRVGIHERRGDGTNPAVVEAWLAQGDGAFPSQPFTTSSVASTSTAYWTTKATSFRFGASLTTGALDATFDDVKLDTAFMPSASGSAGPAAPTGLTASYLSPTATALSWTDNATDETGYVVQRSATGTFQDAVVTTLPANSTSYTDTPATEGPESYRVAAVRGGSTSSYTDVVTNTRIKDITFEDGTPSLVNPLTGASLNANNGIVQETTSPLKGAYSARVPNRNNTYLEQTIAGVDDVYVTFYLRIAAPLPPSDMRLAQVLVTGGGTQANLWLRTNGQLCLKYNGTWSGGTTTTACAKSALQIGTVYRVGIHQRRGDGINPALVESFLVAGDAPFPTAFASSSLSPTTTGYWQGQATAFRIGATLTSSSLDATFDDIKIDSAFLPSASQ